MESNKDESLRTNSKTNPTSPSSESSSSEPTKPKFTSEQVAGIKRIKTCKTFYEVLEVSKEASDADIKKAYRKLALQMHPDKNQAPGAEEAFKRVTQAFSCLSDPKKRQTYDLHGGEDTPAARSPFTRGGGMYYEEDISPEDIFNIFFGIPTAGGNRHRNNFYYSSFPSSRGGVQFNFGGAPNRHHHHHQQRRGGAATEETSLLGLLSLVIPLILLLFSFLGGGSSNTSPSLYSFTKTELFNVPRQIIIDKFKIEIDYFVKSDFQQVLNYNRIRLEKFEDEVVDKWLREKSTNCKRYKQLNELLEKYKGTYYEVSLKDELEKGLLHKFKYCDILKENNII
eukprot:gene4735-5910_t